MPNRWIPGCKCCAQSCPIFSDDFARADSGTIGSGWAENAGTWSIESEELKCVSSNGRCQNAKTILTGATGVFYSMRVKGETSGDQLKMHVSSGTGNYVRLDVGGSATLKLFINGLEVDSCDVTAAEDTFHLLEYHQCGPFGGNDNWVALNGELVVFGFSNPGAIDSSGGAGTGTITTAAYFDDYAVSVLGDIGLIFVVQRSSGSLTGGTWSLTLPGGLGTISGLAYNVSTATATAAGEAVVGAGNITIEQQIFFGPFPYRVEFKNALIGSYDLGTGSADGSALVTAKTLTLSTIQQGYDCEDCGACDFVLMSSGSRFGWDSIRLTIAGIGNASAGGDTDTGCEGFNGTFTLDLIEGADTDCETIEAFYNSEACDCYGVDCDITVTHTPDMGDATVTHLTTIRAVNGYLHFYGTSTVGAADPVAATFAYDFRGILGCYEPPFAADSAAIPTGCNGLDLDNVTIEEG